MEQLFVQVKAWILTLGLPEQYANYGIQGLATLLLCLVSICSFYMVSIILVRRVGALAEKSKTTWDDLLVDRGVFRSISHFVPALVIFYGASAIFSASSPVLVGINKVVFLYMIVAGIWTAQALLRVAEKIYKSIGEEDEREKRPAIGSIIAVLHFVLWAAGGILAMGVVMNLPPTAVVGTLGTVSVVTALFLQKPANRFWSGFELERNGIVKVGDFISLPKFDVSGTVQNLSLSDVTILKSNKTLANIPIETVRDTLIINSRGILEAGKRLLEKTLLIDATSVHFLDDTEFQEAKKLPELGTFFELHPENKSLTNLTVFRAYLSELVGKHESCSVDDGVMVRQLDSSAAGVSVQVRGYLNEPEFTEFEEAASDIFDIILASVNHFGLRLGQDPTNDSLREVSGLQTAHVLKQRRLGS